MRIFMGILLVGLSCGLLVGCSDDGNNSNPTPTPNPNASVALFNPLSQPMEIPFPNNLLFNGSMDGTINAPVSKSNPNDLTVALNKLDGFSTLASAYAAFDRPLAAGQDFSQSVLVFRLAQDGTIVKQLDFGTSNVMGLSQYEVSGDYTVRLNAGTQDAKNDRLLVVPLKPLQPRTRYLIVITRQLMGKNG